jgi:hypothetical protein
MVERVLLQGWSRFCSRVEHNLSQGGDFFEILGQRPTLAHLPAAQE